MTLMKMLFLVCGLAMVCAMNTTVDLTNVTTPTNSTAPTTAYQPKPKQAKTYDAATVMGCVVVVVIFALFFDFSNGFHDTANAVATCIGTKSMYVPRFITMLPWLHDAKEDGPARERLRNLITVIFSAIFNFLPAFLQPLGVANAISKVINIKDFPDGDFVPLGVICTYATLVTAIFWNFLTWNFGLPSSSSHTLIGGMVGAGLAVNGIPGIAWSQLWSIIYGLIGSPAYAAIAAAILMFGVNGGIWLYKKAVKMETGDVDRDCFVWRFLVVVSTAALGWLHGANDAQKTMGIIAATLFAAGYVKMLDSKVIDTPVWVIFACQAMIAVGTAMGGWTIIGRMALEIFPGLRRTSALTANAGTIAALQTATALALPVSTTQAMNSGIVAAGAADSGLKAVKWKVMGTILICWLFTIPVSIFIGFSLGKMMLAPGAWSPFFCVFWGVALLAFMAFCLWRQRKGRQAAADKIVQKFMKAGTDPAAVGLTESREDRTDSAGTTRGDRTDSSGPSSRGDRSEPVTLASRGDRTESAMTSKDEHTNSQADGSSVPLKDEATVGVTLHT